MPFAYTLVQRQSALRLSQMIGADQATLEAAYAGAWASALDGAEIPKTGFKDLILMIAKELAQLIGNNPSHPARTFIYGRSSNLSNLASTPSTDSNGYEFVGQFDSCVDASSNIPCTWMPPQTIEDESDSFFDDVEIYNYNIHGNHIQHTRTSVYLEGCVWDQTTQAALYDAGGDCPLPEVCASIIVNGVCANAGQVGWSDNAGQIASANALYQQGLQLLSGGSNIPLASTNVVAG